MTLRRNPPREWTEEERKRLYDDYFNLLPGICPVCGENVSMMMEHKDAMATSLKLRCRRCGNRGEVIV